MAKRTQQPPPTGKGSRPLKAPVSSPGPSAWKSRLGPRVRAELVGLVTGIICAFLFLALGSYATGDPSWNTAAAAAVPQNLGGVVGAYAADALFQGLGYAAYLVPLALGVYSARYMVLKPIAYPGWVGLGYTLLVVTSAGLLSLLFGEVPFDRLLLPAG
ncbi:MAG TPA: DNA translocase FtsK 4TM domain-containing protein, partial [Deferrisomatales bacterium]|nr:DNA translocase FtsK 4TM domain-containing protein [Deferrisomatales bacterium]